MKTNKVKEILKLFPELTKAEDFRPENSDYGIHFIWDDDDELKSHLILAPFFLNDAFKEKQNMSGNMVHPWTTEQVALLIHTPVYDGKGFGIWVKLHDIDGNANVNWYNLNPGDSDEHAMFVCGKANITHKKYLKLLKEFEVFKTILLLYGIELNIDPDRRE